METLFHYCSVDTFVSIVKNRSIWLSSLRLSNDTMEGQLVNRTMMRLAEKDKIDPSARDRLYKNITLTEDFFDGLGFCLSGDGDLLSQWRGYADDARGVSIGFNRHYLDLLSKKNDTQGESGFALRKVEYEQIEHEHTLKPIYEKLVGLVTSEVPGRTPMMSPEHPYINHQIIEEENRKKDTNQKLSNELLELVPYLFALKLPAFREEQEWRLVSISMRSPLDKTLFRAARNRVIPYRSFELTQMETPAISEVILGPRHETPVEVVQLMLEQAGFPGARVRRSEASYR
jgi:Protein of unknown function (DUF2971)